MADKLSSYNAALGHLFERKLGSLSENREPRRVLDDYWDKAVAYCLERKFWNFSYRAVQIDASDSIVPSFGFQYAFTIPDDWVRTHQLSSVPTLRPPLLHFKEESGYWYADVTPLYATYNSNDSSYGMNLGAWPESFTNYVDLRLARLGCKRITGKADLLVGPDGLIKQEEKAHKVAAANCAMNEAVGFPPPSRWVTSRVGWGMRGDEPSGGSLIG